MSLKMINHPAWDKFNNIFYTFTEKVDYLDIDHLDNCQNILSSQNIKVDKVITAKQVHGSLVNIISTSSKKSDQDEDGLITNSPGIALAIRTADCIPILIFDPQKKVISALHSGWKGTRLEILKEAVIKMKTHFNSHLDDIHVLTGPHIYDCCYEIKEDVADQFKNPDTTAQPIVQRGKRSKRTYLNLLAQIKMTAQQLGLKHFDSIGLCTACSKSSKNNKRFFSFRRDKNLKGYQYAIIILKK